MVIELHVPFTPLMSAIQTAVLDIVHFCVKEIKRLNPSVSINFTNNTNVSRITIWNEAECVVEKCKGYFILSGPHP
jgi:hypothetical protein